MRYKPTAYRIFPQSALRHDIFEPCCMETLEMKMARKQYNLQWHFSDLLRRLNDPRDRDTIPPVNVLTDCLYNSDGLPRHVSLNKPPKTENDYLHAIYDYDYSL